MKIEVGKKYRDADGNEVHIFEDSGDSEGQFYGYDGLNYRYYSEDGSYYGKGKKHLDLIEEVTEAYRDYEATIKQLDARKKRIMANFKSAIAIQAIMLSVCICGAMFGLSRAEEYYKHQDKVNQENVYVKPR